MILLLTILIAIALLYLVGKAYRARQFEKEVATLFNNSKPNSGPLYSEKLLAGLPAPVQRYFRLVLKEGQSRISYARITHDGQFKTGPDKDWVNIKGEQYATTQQPGFIWKGTTSLFTARDMYILDKGRLVVSIFGLVKVVDGQGASYDQGELLRWLGESVLYPTNLLPGPNLRWSAIDAHTAEFTFHHLALVLHYRVTFNDIGEITELETKRYMDKDHLTTWIIKIAGYRQMNQVKVPTAFEVIWRLKPADLSYAKFHITKVEYDRPELF
jgi:hypothetical protein